MSVENTTPNRRYQLPFGSNNLEDDVLRLVAAFSAIDVDIAGLLVSVAQRALLVHSHVIADTTGLQAALDSKQDESEKGNANGYASLGADGKVPAAQLPSALFGSLNYQGDWNANTNTPTIPAAAAGNKGWYYMVSVAGVSSVAGITDWKVGDWAVSDGTKWVKIDNTDAVASVAGLTGAITAAALKTALAITVADITDASANGRSLISAANYAAMKTLLGITAADITNASANGRSLITAADYAAMRTLLGLVIGTTVAAIASPAFTGTPTAPTAALGTNTTQIATTAFVQNAAGSLPFKQRFESAQQTITAGGPLTLAHGLAAQPKLYLIYLQCVTAENGYAVGDEITFSATNSNGVTIVPDATNLNIRYGSNAQPFFANNKNTGANAGLTNANWRAVFRAWA
ncbi:hypothetical protein P9273_21375 [Mesorhizobium sp. WSM4935]|uniref:hypothetical protein n=1 Tax=Mesorhizobium sp. WSM4935 TaxID=3038547 RepID=UPI00241512DC|nr:hypothetical protein [Mesorhizobium sp. WSM4935]MDG4877657.1 hypothetical protein [Mesorhizobium sp. WSM4935]